LVPQLAQDEEPDDAAKVPAAHEVQFQEPLVAE
jgi:hypothetical protein